MVGIQINQEFLDLEPGTTLEIEQENPRIQFNGEVKGDFSLPFDVRNTERNLRLLDWAGVLQKRVNNQGIDCQVFDNIRQHSIGKIKIEKSEINRNHTVIGRVSCYYLSGVSSFFQDIKDILLTQVDYGGDRNFAFPFQNPLMNDSSNPFWQHIHQVLTAPVNSYDYAFFPVWNQAWQGQDTQTDEMNRLTFSGGAWKFDTRTSDSKDGNVIVPFPYLHYVLKKAIAHVGWTIEGDILTDADFLKITMVNFFAVDCFVHQPFFTNFAGRPITKGSATINLQNHVPRMTIAEFLIGLKNRFGWWFDFDRKNKVIRIQQLKNVVSTNVKDFTHLASPVVTKKVESQGKVYALKNEFVGEYADGNPDLANVNYMGEVTQLSALPPATSAKVGQVYLARLENQFFQCVAVDNTTYTWQFYAYNVYNVEPDGATDEITTKATTIGSDYSTKYAQYVPRMDFLGIWLDRTMADAEWGIHLLMFHGFQNNTAGTPTPFATSGIYNPQNVQVSNWSVCFECKKTDGTDVGLYATNWKEVLESLSHPEQFEFAINLSLPDFLDLKFSDVIVVDGVKMYLSKIKSTVPFMRPGDEFGTILVEAIRIN